ncbi:MAG: hypothetical protein LBK42_13820 [Propionibacteriaceae bacterium]|nr:hypothetical protein [Propionibacteriaceae bacterium]
MERRLRPCGTQAAYRRHLRHGEKPCGACLAANTIASRRTRSDDRPPAPLTPLPSLENPWAGRPEPGPMPDHVAELSDLYQTIKNDFLNTHDPVKRVALSRELRAIQTDYQEAALAAGLTTRKGGIDVIDELAMHRAGR